MTMDHIVIKQENPIKQEQLGLEITNNVSLGTDFSLGRPTSQVGTASFTSFENMQSEVGNGDSINSSHIVAVPSGANLSQQNVTIVSQAGLFQQQQQHQSSQVKLVNVTSSNLHVPSGQNNQIILSSTAQTGRGGQVLAGANKRPAAVATSQGQLFTKILLKGSSSGAHVLPAGSIPVSTVYNQSIVAQSSLTSSAMNRTPTKTITLLQSPQKLTGLPGTPTKQMVPMGKIPISPLKSPTKVHMIPMSGKSPQKASQVSGGSYVMVARTQNSVSTVVSANKPTTITMSPSKVFIKGQTVQVPSVMGPQSGLAQAQVSKVSQTVPLSNLPSNVQPLSVTGNKFQYVRLVTTPASSQSNSTGLRPTTIAPALLKSLSNSTNSAPVKIAMAQQQQIQVVNKAAQPLQAHGLTQQRFILPATSQVLQAGTMAVPQQVTPVRPQPHQLTQSATASASVPPGQPINLQTVQGYALIPAHYVSQPQQQALPVPQTSHLKQESYHAAPSAQASNRNNNTGRATHSEPGGQRPRKPCNCTKSQCLKLYCDCFANGEFCNNCNCTNCYNNLDHEEERQRAIKTCLERNPNAFHPKIGKARSTDGNRMHNKGCNCKRSGCLKNYCECYEAKILCTALCKCCGCKNFEESPDRKTLIHLAEAAEVRVQQQTAAKTKLSSQIDGLSTKPQAPSNGERLPYTFVTAEVAEAVCSCLVAQAEECERLRHLEVTEERLILQEFGRCLVQVIQSAGKTKAPSPVP